MDGSIVFAHVIKTGVFDRWDNAKIPKRYGLSPEERNQIAQDHPGDTELYKLALSLRKTRKNDICHRS